MERVQVQSLRRTESSRPTVCHVFPFERADGPVNMARDEAMLAYVSQDPSVPMIRLYGWSEPTLSLGYFQTYSDALSDPRWRTVPIVRRPTGGGAIWHEHELTYAIVVPADHAFASRTEDLYRSVHSIFLSLFSHVGREARAADDWRNSEARRPFLCFADHSVHDVLVRGSKVVGSAQRRRKGVVLQHGSILLRGSQATPEFPGVTDDREGETNPEEKWVQLITERLSRILARSVEHRVWPESLLKHSEALEHEVYRSDAWTRRR